MNKASNACDNSKERIRTFQVIESERLIKVFVLGEKENLSLILANAIKNSEGVRAILNDAFVLADLGKVKNV